MRIQMWLFLPLFLFALTTAADEKSAQAERSEELLINGTDLFEYIRSNRQKQSESPSCASDEAKIREKAVMVIGMSGTGKSTLVNYLSGVKLVSVKLKSKWVVEVAPDATKKLPCGFEIGHQTSAKTLYPSAYSPPGLDYSFVDNPGFQDTRGLATEIANGFFIQDVTQRVDMLKFLLLISQSDLNDRASQFRQSVRLTTTFLQLTKYTEASMISQLSRSMGIVVTKGNNLGETYESVVEACIEKMNETLVEEKEQNSLDDNTWAFFQQILQNSQIGVFSGRRKAGQLDDHEKEMIQKLLDNGLAYVDKDDVNIGITIGSSYTINLSDYLKRKFQEFDAHVSNLTIEAIVQVFNSTETLNAERANELKELQRAVTKLAAPSINFSTTYHLLSRITKSGQVNVNLTRLESSWGMFDYLVSLLSDESKRTVKERESLSVISSQFNNRLAMYLRLNMNLLVERLHSELTRVFTSLFTEESIDELIRSHQAFNKYVASSGHKIDMSVIKSIGTEIKLSQDFVKQVDLLSQSVDYFSKLLPEENQLLIKTSYDVGVLTRSLNLQVSHFLNRLINSRADQCVSKSNLWIEKVIDSRDDDSTLSAQHYQAVKRVNGMLQDMIDQTRWCMNMTDEMIAGLQDQDQEIFDQDFESSIITGRKAFVYCNSRSTSSSNNNWCDIKVSNKTDMEQVMIKFNQQISDLTTREFETIVQRLRIGIIDSLEKQLPAIVDGPIEREEAKLRFKQFLNKVELASIEATSFELIENYADLLDADSKRVFYEQRETKMNETHAMILDHVDSISDDLAKLNDSTLVYDEQTNILSYRGHYGKLSNVLAELEARQDISNLNMVRILATQRFEIDVDFKVNKQKYEFNAPHLIIASPNVTVVADGSTVTIDLSCEHVPGYPDNVSKSPDGRRRETSGKDGKPGLPGCNGGSLFIIANQSPDKSMLGFISSGGVGGPGQDGGNGVDGEDGEHSMNKYRYLLPSPVYRLGRSEKLAHRYSLYSQTRPKVVRQSEAYEINDAVCSNHGLWSDYHEGRRTRVRDYLRSHQQVEEYVDACDETSLGMRNDEHYVLTFQGDKGEQGGNGGRGGAGGVGGSNGKGLFIGTSSKQQSQFDELSVRSGITKRRGADGKPGLAGSGGRDGNTTELVYAYFRPNLRYSLIPVFGQLIEFNLLNFGWRYCFLKDKIDYFEYQPNGRVPEELNSQGLEQPASYNSLDIAQESISELGKWMSTNMESFARIKSLFSHSLQ